MPGVPRELAEHKLHVDPKVRPVKQTLRPFNAERHRAMGEEVNRLLAAGFIRPIKHPKWLANPVMVQKKNKTWRMCIDYTNLNAACPKEEFMLPRIDQIVDSTAGSESLCFLDAYSGYNQIKVSKEDEEKTAFITPFGAFCYTAMTFGLRNAGATYQRCMQECLANQIGRNIHVYIDDVVVKSDRQDNILADLAETFDNLRRYKIKLNPSKCTFGVPSGQLLGYVVSKRGIEANPEKIDTLLKLGKPECLRDVQKLAGRVAALSRFIPRLGEKAIPLYKLLRKNPGFEWTKEADDALAQLKAVLATSPLLAAPTPNEPMLMYIAATNRVVSTVLVVERPEEGRERPVQHPVYYLSEVLTESKQRYPQYQKLAYAVFRATRRLPHYFQQHQIRVISDTPLKDIIRNRDATGRIAKWAVEIGIHNIKYDPRHAVKSQALADFLVDWIEAQQPERPAPFQYWQMYFDGSKNADGAGGGIVLSSPHGDKLRYALRIDFTPCTNNVAEYEALLHGMRAAKEMGVSRLKCYGDSDLVAGQVTGTCDANAPNMIAYRRAVDQVGASFAGYSVEWVDRRKNEEADALSRIGSSNQAPPPGVFFDVIDKPSVSPPKEIDIAVPPAPDPQLVAVVGETHDWTAPYIAYLEHGTLPKDETEARMIVRRCKSFVMIEGELFRRSTTGIFQRCVSPEEGQKILYDIHAGDCGHHAGAKTLVAKANRHGFYWLSAKADAVDIVRRCAGCQRFANQTHLPGSALKTIPITWPFAVWGLDMVGPFKKAPGGFTHLLVAVDKFTKWVEAKPVTKCDGKTATKFLRDIIYRFGFPHSTITDNGTNFAKGHMAEFCQEHHIRLDIASVANPQANGQVERANQSILHGLKPRLQEPLERAAGCWVEELPSVLWGIRTSENRSTGFTPFFMVYGAEAVMPTDLEHDSPRVVSYVEENNETNRQDGLDTLDEERDLARSRTAIYQQGLRRYHSRRVRTRTFQEGDLVLRLKQNKTGMHKLSPPWEGPFAIGRVLGKDSYYLIDVRGGGRTARRPTPLERQSPAQVLPVRSYQ